LKKLLLHCLMAIGFLASIVDASATTASITGNYAAYAKHPVRVGEAIEIQGHCASVNDGELVRSQEWRIDGESYIPKTNDGKPFHAGTTILIHKVRPPSDREFTAQLTCFTNAAPFRQDDRASRTFRILPRPKIPTVSWNNKTSASGTFSSPHNIFVNVMDGGDGVGGVWVTWSGDEGKKTKMSPAADGLYQYTVPYRRMPVGKSDIRVWAENSNGDSDGWRTVGSVTIQEDKKQSLPEMTWSGPLPEFVGDWFYIHVTAMAYDARVVDVVLVDDKNNGYTMEHQGTGGDYIYRFPTKGIAEGDRRAIRAYVYDSNANSSGVQAIGSFTVDRTVPVVTWNTSNPVDAKDSITLTANITDNLSGIASAFLEWGFPDGSFVRWPMTHGIGNRYNLTIDTSKLPEGAREIYIFASDRAGNESLKTLHGQFTVDHTQPVIDWSAPRDKAIFTVGDTMRINGAIPEINAAKVTIEWRVEKDSTWQTKMLDVPAGQKVFQYDLPDLTPGNYQLRTRASDSLGNVSDYMTTRSITVEAADELPPVITWFDKDPLYVRDSIVIKLDAIDEGSGIDHISISWDDKTWLPMPNDPEKKDGFLLEIDTGKLSDGIKNVRVQAVDKKGNTTGPQLLRTFTVDRTDPTVTWHTTNPVYAKDRVTLTADVADSGAGIATAFLEWGFPNKQYTSVEMMHGPGDTYSVTIDTADLSEGIRDVYIYATDKAGNKNADRWKGQFDVDHTPPTVFWLAPVDQASLASDGSIRITGTIAETHAAKVTIEWRPEKADTWQTRTVDVAARERFFDTTLCNLETGNYTLRIRAVDSFGNVSGYTAERTVTGKYAIDELIESVRLAIEPDSLSDKDHSGGYSAGDSFVYQLAIRAKSRAAQGLSLQYRLPNGLALTQGLAPFLRGLPATAQQQLNAHWNGGGDTALLITGVGLAANDTMYLDIPVTLTGATAVTGNLVLSAIQIRASNMSGEMRAGHTLALQRTYPANAALKLSLRSSQADWKYVAGTRFDYRVSLRSMAWEVTNMQVHYTLPPGLSRDGPLRIEGETGADATSAAIAVNPDWNRNGDTWLLSHRTLADLKPYSEIVIVVPVVVARTVVADVPIPSEIDATASNLRGAASTIHQFTPDGPHTSEEQLRLEKTVDKKVALPGANLRYTIRFTNVGVRDVKTLVIRDTLQENYLTLLSAQCDAAMPPALQCHVAATRQPGTLEWHLDGVLMVGESGSVSYEAQIGR
jgi:uncharacterized repeat protein (TIGR01451 family)